MKLAQGPRPLSIKLFAAFFLTAAISTYVLNLTNLPIQQEIFALYLPWPGWSQDWTIVALSAILSIAFIPVAWIYLRASRVARWLVTGFSLLKLLSFPQMFMVWVSDPYINIMYLREPILIALALIMLFTPSANRWFRQTQEPDLAVFE